jgi:Na+/proline symporter
MGLFLAIPLWKEKITTIADLFGRYYSPRIETFAVLLLWPTSILWAAAQMKAFGHVLATASPMSAEMGCVVALVMVLLYTVPGGMLADAWTDLLQGVLLIGGLLLLLYLAFEDAGSPSALVAKIPTDQLHFFGGPDTPWWEIAELWAVPVLGSLMAQELVSRVIAMRSPEMAARVTLGATGLYVAVGMIPVILGLVAAQTIPGLENSEEALPTMARQMMPGILYVVFAGALVSAILSTVDTALLVAGSLISHNLINRLSPGRDEGGKVLVGRIAVALCGIAAFVLAITGESVYALVEEASGFGSSGILVCLLAALFLKRGGVYAAWGSLIAGLVSWILFAYIHEIPTPYLVSIASALAGYIGGAFFDSWKKWPERREDCETLAA